MKILVDLEKYTAKRFDGVYQAGFMLRQYNLTFKYNVDVAMWFPTDEKERYYQYLPYIQGYVVESSPMMNSRFPLVIISSGYAGTMYDQSYLAEALARNGYFVLSIAHTVFDRGKFLGCERAWYRSCEIKESINFIYNVFSDHVLETVSLIGFSAGGFSSLLLTRARSNFQLDKKFLPYLNYLGNLDFSVLQDNRVKNLCLFAPALGILFHPAELKKINQNVLLITAERDEVLLDTTENYEYYIKSIIANKVIKNAGHFVFNSAVSNVMKKVSPKSCVDIGVGRHRVHPFLIQETVEFLNSSLNYKPLGRKDE